MNSPLASSRRKATAFLLDFDGPITRLFTHHPAPLAVLELRALLSEAGYEIDPDFSMGMLSLLREAQRRDLPTKFIAQLNSSLSAYELKAALNAPPSPGAHDAIKALTELFIPTAIVTNNSETAVQAYLKLHQLPLLPVVARDPLDFLSMKPSPIPLLKALEILGTEPLDAIMLGDQPSDMVAAHAAGVRALGYAKSENHASRLWESRAEEVIFHLDQLHLYF